MRKSRIVPLTLVLVLLLAGIGAGVFAACAGDDIEQAHLKVYSQYIQLFYNGQGSSVTVMEDGAVTGVYSLADLGLWADFKASLDAQFGVADRMDPDAFAALSRQEKQAWSEETHPQVDAVSIPTDHLDVEAVLADLNRVPREDSRDAYASFTGGAYEVFPETVGNAVSEDALRAALADCAASLEITRQGPKTLTLELTDYACYSLPEVTLENADFAFDALLARDLQNVQIALDFHGTSEVLSQETLSALVSADGEGHLEIQPAMQDFLAAYAETHREENTPYLFDSYASGPVPIDFLTCTYTVDAEALGQALTEALLNLESGVIQVPYLCTGSDGQPIELTDTYVEVDIANQQMTYYKDGELIVHTDVVTGFRRWRDTPTGLYSVQNKDTDCWLSGPDFNVFIKYWVGFIGTLYGLHDASWRDEFGGDIYTKNGSHGCVNTPEDAMAIIHETIDIGTPVLVYDISS